MGAEASVLIRQIKVPQRLGLAHTSRGRGTQPAHQPQLLWGQHRPHLARFTDKKEGANVTVFNLRDGPATFGARSLPQGAGSRAKASPQCRREVDGRGRDGEHLCRHTPEALIATVSNGLPSRQV